MGLNSNVKYNVIFKYNCILAQKIEKYKKEFVTYTYSFIWIFPFSNFPDIHLELKFLVLCHLLKKRVEMNVRNDIQSNQIKFSILLWENLFLLKLLAGFVL